MSRSLVEQFAEDGYFVVPELLGREHCAELLAEVVESFSTSPQTTIREAKFRRHSPLSLSDSVGDALSLALEYGYEPLSDLLQNQKDLVELSSISVFPNAAEQALHRDEANEGHYLASVFINLTDTREDAGALRLIPKSHHLEGGGLGETISLTLPVGSAVFMNSKLLHAGSANTSSDRIRSVFYFTMGEDKLYGPPYSILDEVSAQALTLEQLQPRIGQSRVHPSGQSRPQLHPDSKILLPLSSEESRTELLLCHKDKLRRRLVLEEEQEFWVELLQEIECHARELTIEDLCERHDQSLSTLLPRFVALARSGWLCW